MDLESRFMIVIGINQIVNHQILIFFSWKRGKNLVFKEFFFVFKFFFLYLPWNWFMEKGHGKRYNFGDNDNFPFKY